MKLPTVKVKDGNGGFYVINESDLTDKHELFDKPSKQKKAKNKKEE